MTIHIEGFGWTGSVLARRLEALGVDFTWSDSDSPINAWQASTGLVYPTGEPDSEEARRQWLAWHERGLFAPHSQIVRYWYSHKAHPHGLKVKADLDVGWLRRSPELAVQLNVARIVEDTRARFAGCRVSAPAPGARIVVCHGWGPRTTHSVWGWSRQVRLSVPADIAGDGLYSMNLHRSRFEFTYAYAVPGRPGWHYAGSSMVRQREPRTLDLDKHFARWLEAVAEVAPPVKVLEMDPVTLQGWRPKGETLTWEPFEDGDRLYVPPLYHSGVRWAPLVSSALLERLGLPTAA